MTAQALDRLLSSVGAGVDFTHPLVLDVAIGVALGVAIGFALSFVRDHLG